MSLIMHDVKAMTCGHYVSGVSDANTGIWWYCDDDEITEMSVFPEGVHTREIHHKFTKRTLISGSVKMLLMVYIITSKLIEFRYFVYKYVSHLSKINHMK